MCLSDTPTALSLRGPSVVLTVKVKSLKPQHLYISTYLFDIYLYKMTQTQILEGGHSPTLNTVLMVEEVLKEAGQVLSVAEVKRRLPRKVMHQTLLPILDYLQMSGKIVLGTKGVLWIFAERKELDSLIKKGMEI